MILEFPSTGRILRFRNDLLIPLGLSPIPAKMPNYLDLGIVYCMVTVGKKIGLF